MAIKKARTNASGSSVAMAAEIPPHDVSHNEPPPPPRPLPPGVYFSPTREECLGFLNRWIAGDNEMPDARGHISVADVYGEGPDTLCRRHAPASIRGPGEHAWWFLSQTRFQSQAAGGAASKRADRGVETVGFWRMENGKNELEALDGVKNSFGFYVGRSKNKKQDKTPWLMQELTRGQDDGAGKPGVPALYRVYLTPHATSNGDTSLGRRACGSGPTGQRSLSGPWSRRSVSMASPGCCRQGVSVVVSAKST